MKKIKILVLGALATIIALGPIGIKVFAEDLKGDENTDNYKKTQESRTINSKNNDMKFIDNLINKNEYEEIYKVKKSEIQSISGNGGNYGNSSIDKAIDGNDNIWFETGRPNSDTFKNEVIINFFKNENIARITYVPRIGNKGYMEEYKIYGSATELGDDFELLAQGKGSITSNETEINFKESNVKRIKIVFEKANQDWAAIGELGFYKEDKILNEINSIFKDKLETQVSESYKDINKLENLKKVVSTHPLKQEFLGKINQAIDELNGNSNNKFKIFKPMQLGNLEKHSLENLKIQYGTNLQSIGTYVNPGEKITVYVDVDNEDKIPSLVVTQHVGEWSNWKRDIELKPGKNIITIPEIYNNNWSTKVNKGGAIYISNPYTKEEQGNVSIRIDGGKNYPVFREGDNVNQFIETLKKSKQDFDKDKTGTFIDIVEVIGRRELFTLRTNGAYKSFVENGKNPQEIIEAWNTSIDEIIKFNGLNGNSKTTNGSNLYETFRVMQPYAFMYAAGDHIGFQEPEQDALLDINSIESGSWGFFHEIGHNFENHDMSWSEISNNLIPIDKITKNKNFKLGDERMDWELIYSKVAPINSKNNYDDFSTFDKIGVFWQLELAKPGYWAEMNKRYRENDLKFKGSEWKVDNFIAISSDIFGKDLTEYFSKYGFNSSTQVKTYLSKYPKLERKIWYLNSSARFYNGVGYENKDILNEDIKIDKNQNDIILKFSSKPEYKNDLLGYEILKNGKVIGFTTKEIFIDSFKEEYKDDYDSVYEIIAYAKNLTKSKSIKITQTPISKKPIIKGLDKLNIESGSKVDLTKGVKATDYKGNDISKDIIISGQVDFNVPGTYEVRYIVKDSNGNAISEKREIIITPSLGNKKPIIKGLDKLNIESGSKVDLRKGVKATDYKGNDISKDIVISGQVNLNIPGTYEARYIVRDSNGNAISEKREIIVTVSQH